MSINIHEHDRGWPPLRSGVKLEPNGQAGDGRVIATEIWKHLLRDNVASWYDLFNMWICAPDQYAGQQTTNPIELRMPTGLAGLALPFARARWTLDAIGGPEGALASRNEVRPKAKTLSSIGRPWLGDPNALERMASIGGKTALGDLRRLGPPDPVDALIQSVTSSSVVPGSAEAFYLADIDADELVTSALGHNGRDMLGIFDRLHALHFAGLSAVENHAGELQPESQGRLAAKRILHLMSSPVLMRLFGLARDFVFELPAPPPSGAEAFWRISISPHDDDVVGPATAVKYRAEAGGRAGTFCAVTSEEWKRAPAGSYAERDGVRLLPDSRLGVDGYALVSIEPALGLQADAYVQRVQRDEPAAGDAKVDPSPALRSGGIALTSRRSKGSTTPNLFQFCSPADGGTLFAHDIHQFDRLDIGVEVASDGRTATEWRATTNRILKHEFPDGAVAPPDWIEEFVNRLLGNLRGLRHELDATHLTEGALVGTAAHREVYVTDERVAVWVGESGSIPFDAVDYDRPTREKRGGRTLYLSPDDGPLALKYKAELPTKPPSAGEADARLPVLRFGWRYRVGVRRVYLGGACLPLSEASKVYDSGEQTCIPTSSRRNSAFPYLRHEPIGAPEAYLAPSEPKDAGTDTRLQSAGRAVLVTWRGKIPSKRRPVQSTARVLLVPRVPFEFAMLHEAFDGREVVRTKVPGDDETKPGESYMGIRPADGLTRVKFFDPKQRPPVTLQHGEPTKIEQSPARFEILPKDEDYRPNPYYPDPAASYLVLRLKRFGSDAGWLNEPALVVPVQRHGGRGLWPNLLPVHVEIRAAPDREVDRRAGGEIPRLMTGTVALRHLDAAGRFVDESSDAMPVQSVLIALAPGEQASLDAWFVPSIEDLDGWFDLCRTIGLMSRAEARKNGKAADDRTDTRRGLEQLIGPDRCARDPHSDVAATLQHHMLQAPLSVLADVRTFDLVHAVDMPIAPPRFVIASPRSPMAPASRPDLHFPHFSPAKFARRRDDGGSALAHFVSQRRNADDWSNDSEDGGRHLLVGGMVSIESASSSGVVIEANGVGLNGRKLDDPEVRARERTADELNFDNYKAGFAVLADGQPKFVEGTPVEILRVDGIPSPGSAVGGGHGPIITQRRVEIELADPAGFHEPTASPDKPPANPTMQSATAKLATTSPTLRAAASQIIRDGGARWLELRPIAIARHRGLLADEFPPERPVGATTERPAAPAASKEADFGLLRGESRQLLEGWVPATDRPAPCFRPRLVVMKQPAEASLPVRRRYGSSRSIQQSMRPFFRLYLDRPWFTSGEGELLGFVHWPPIGPPRTIGDVSTKDFIRTLIPDDLGPLGAHVSSWGRNTRRIWHGPSSEDKPLGGGAFVPPGAISGAGPFTLDAPRNALMPVPGTGSGPGNELLSPVTITTVAPRFDVEEQRWYVDLHVDSGSAPDPFVHIAVVRYQPNAREDRYISGTYSGIRCSLPARASGWVQSSRDVTAIVRRTRLDGKEMVNITVSVKGSIGLPLNEPAATGGGTPPERRPQPALRVQLWRTRDAQDEPVIDAAGSEAFWESWNPKTGEAPSVGSRGPDFWATGFVLPANSIDRSFRYRVLVEEGEVMPHVYDTNDTADLSFGLTRMICALDCTEDLAGI